MQETLSIYEGRTTGFSEEIGDKETYTEVLTPLFSLYRCIQPEVHC